MKLLLDTDVVIDFAVNRKPFTEAASDLLDALERAPGTAFVAWHTISNFYYMVSSDLGKADARAFIADFCSFVKVAPTTTKDVRCAVSQPLGDFEDALQVAAAAACGADRIVTRNLKHYRRSPVMAIRPHEALRLLQRDA